MSAEAVDDGPERGIRVLHVDDDPALLDLAASFLERVAPEFEVLTAESADAAMDVVRAEPVDCVVSDYDMPGTDGLELLSAVRDLDEDLPFILFTGKGSEEIASRAISAGVTDYLQKDLGRNQFELLVNRIERYVDRTRTAAALAESRRRLSTLMDNLPGMVYRCRNERGWPMEFVSEGSVDLAGYAPDDLESGAVVWGEDVLHGDDREAVWEAVQSALDADEPFRVTYRIRTAGGALRWVWEQGVGVRDGDGDLQALEGFITDVTERRELEAAARRAARRFEAVVEASPFPIFALDADGAVTVWNAAAAAAFGWAEDEVLGEPLPLVPPEMSEEHREVFERAMAGESIRGLEVERATADDGRVRFTLSTAPLTGPDGEITGVMSMATDLAPRDGHR